MGSFFEAQNQRRKAIGNITHPQKSSSIRWMKHKTLLV
jgi:hypothetical protein